MEVSCPEVSLRMFLPVTGIKLGQVVRYEERYAEPIVGSANGSMEFGSGRSLAFSYFYLTRCHRMCSTIVTKKFDAFKTAIGSAIQRRLPARKASTGTFRPSAVGRGRPVRGTLGTSNFVLPLAA
jgi:hypothetical protein